MPEPWSPTIEELTDAGVRGVVYAHEIVRVPVGTVRAFLDTLAEVGVPALEPLGLRCVGAYRVAMINDTEAIVIWALPSWEAWGRYEQAWDGPQLAAWRARLVDAERRRATHADGRRAAQPDAHRPPTAGRGPPPARRDLAPTTLTTVVRLLRPECG